MGTQFRCRRSGNILSFSNPIDIMHVRKCESYEEIKNEANANETIEIPQAAKAKVLITQAKRKGRPPKSRGLRA